MTTVRPAGLIPPASVFWAARANDNCSGAIEMAEGLTYSISTATATSSDVFSCAHDKSVWFSFTPLITDWVTISTFESDYLTALQVYEGTCESLNPISCSSIFL